MKQEKEVIGTVEEQFAALTKQVADEREAKEDNIMQAIQYLEHDGCVLHTRRLYMDMCLQYASDHHNAVDDHDRLTMLSLFEVLNVM